MKFQESFNFLKEYKKTEKISDFFLLEIGAGEGAFIKKVVKYLTTADKVLATEFSDYGKKEIESIGVKCTRQNILEIDHSQTSNGFNFICIFQVLEHFDDIEQIFLHLAKIINNNGYLIIAVPNNIHRERFERLGYFEDIPLTHTSRWSKNNFIFLAESYGWKLVRHKIEPTNPFKNIYKYISKHKNPKLFNDLNKINFLLLRKIIKGIATIF